jgi:glycosyltransferase involved in cell wall biosynthesis
MKKKIKIYIFHPYSQIGGADLSLSRLINLLPTNKYEIIFLCLQKAKIQKYLKKKIKIINFESKRTIYTVLKIRKFLKNDHNNRYKKHIFFSNQNFANVLSFLIILRLDWIKLICIERNHIDELKLKNNLIKKIKNLVILLLIKNLYKYADLVIGISKKLSLDLSKYANCKVKTIYNPSYDTDIYKLAKVKIKKKLIKKNLILNVARFEKQKDHLTLLKAFKIVVKKIDCTLLLIGYGSEINNIKKYIKENNLSKNIIILSNIKNPYPYFKISKLFILSSIYEGFGNVLVEAAMFNLKIISSNCNSGPKEILSRNRGGDLFEVGNYCDLSKKIIKNLNDDNIKKNKFMKKRINLFLKEKIVKQYHQEFVKI